MSFNDSNLSVCKLPTSTVYLPFTEIEPSEETWIIDSFRQFQKVRYQNQSQPIVCIDIHIALYMLCLRIRAQLHGVSV